MNLQSLDLWGPGGLSGGGLWALFLLGISLCLFGIPVARLLVVSLFGAAAAAGAVIVGPSLGIHAAPLSFGIVGFILGSLVAILAFRQLQAVLLALGLGLLVAVIGCGWNASGSASLTSLTQLATLKGLLAAKASLLAHVQQTTPGILPQLALTVLVTMIMAWLLALRFPRLTTAFITALVGAALAILTGLLLLGGHAPAALRYWPPTDRAQYAILAVLATAGLLIQCSFFLRSSDKAGRTSGTSTPGS